MRSLNIEGPLASEQPVMVLTLSDYDVSWLTALLRRSAERSRDSDRWPDLQSKDINLLKSLADMIERKGNST